MNAVKFIGHKHKFNYNGVEVLVFHANIGEGLPQHNHAYSHATMCNSGKCLIRVKGKEYIVTKDSTPINLPAGEYHEIEALENDTVFVNIFAEGKY